MIYNLNNPPLVSLDSMNVTHMQEIEIIKLFLEQIENSADNDLLSTTFEKLLQHMQQHFSGEETLMKEFHYPSLNIHQADHTKVLNQARYAEMEWRNKKDVEALSEYLQEELIPWLDQHIKAMDTPMADFISM